MHVQSLSQRWYRKYLITVLNSLCMTFYTPVTTNPSTLAPPKIRLPSPPPHTRLNVIKFRVVYWGETESTGGRVVEEESCIDFRFG
jgi:hypothetical protein